MTDSPLLPELINSNEYTENLLSIFEDLTEEDKISQDSDFPFSLSGENSNSIKKLWKIVYARFLFIDFLIFVLHRF